MKDGIRSGTLAWTLTLVALVSQALTWLVFGHIAYLWVQGTEALVAFVVLSAFGIRYWRQDPRESRWPPLFPLAAIALAGGVKDVLVALDAPTPTWLVTSLLAAVLWFLAASWTIWRTESRSPSNDERRGGLNVKSLAYWIQRADFSATNHAPVDVATALRAFDAHPWQNELKLQLALENGGRDYCPPGIGFVDPDGSILHVCPTADGRR